MRIRIFSLLLAASAVSGLSARAQSLRGIVEDGVGRPIAGASLQLVPAAGGSPVTASTDASGAFALSPAPGVYTLTVSRPSFAEARLPVSVPAPNPLLVTLDLAPVQQSLVVTATGVPAPQTQLGQSVEVVDRAAIDERDALTVDESLRQATAVQVTTAGAVGGLTSVMLRGGDPGFNKILLDGVPLQRIDFGAYDFSTLTPEALDSVTVVRGADSVVYGTDAAAGVIDMRSRSGLGLAAPELLLTSMSGSYGTSQQSAALLGDWKALDYALAFGYLDTKNQVPNNKAWNQSFTANLGLRLSARSQARLTLRRTSSYAGDPNAFEFFGVADDSFQRQGETYAGLTWRQQATARWSNQLELSQSQVDYFYDTVAPVGQLSGGNYLGNTVTIVGANGYRVTGQAILDYGYSPFPQPFPSDTQGDFATAQTSFQFTPLVKLIAGYRYSNEAGTTAPTLQWHDNGVFAEASAGAWNRLFASAGASEDRHSLFGGTVNPQASLAFLPRLQRGGWWDEIRLHANAATALKDPNITQDQSSLYQDVLAAGASPAALRVSPIAPQRARTFDAGIDQYLAADRVRLSATWFDDRYYNLIQFVPATAFGSLGLPPAAIAAAQLAGGAYLNSWSESSRGAEFELQARGRSGWHAAVSYTWLRPVVLQSYSSDAVSPSFNPLFPSIPIGAYSPLVGARPFHVAPESGSVTAGWRHGPVDLAASLSAASRRDDSTFLSDANYGNTMLLPNHDLAPAYAALNLGADYRMNARLTWQAVVENLANRNYQEIFGYPSLGRAARVGFRLTLSPPRGAR